MIKMANLRILSLECIRTDDSGEEIVFDADSIDEPFLKVNYKTVWSGRMDSGDTVDLTSLDGIPFEGDIRVELWERDPGYTVGEDDLLGKLLVHSSQKGAGSINHKFVSKRARYSLEYSVE